MSLDELSADVEQAYSDLGSVDVDLDEESRMELAMLQAALDVADPSDLVTRAIHILFQSTVDTGKLDFHLRSSYDVTYDEYLMGTTLDAYHEQQGFPQPDENDNRRYQF